jgi:hypothetical protein
VHSGSQLSIRRHIPEDSTIHAQRRANTNSQSYLKTSRLCHARAATVRGPLCRHDNALFPISCWQCDWGLLFILPHTTRRRDWLSSWTSICLFLCLVVYVSVVLCLSHTRHFIHRIRSPLYLDTLCHYTRFIPKPLSSISAHMTVLTDTVDPSSLEV